MRITIRPMLAPDRELDVTEHLVQAIAGRMSAELGGNDQLNLLEAQMHLGRILGLAAPDAASARGVTR